MRPAADHSERRVIAIAQGILAGGAARAVGMTASVVVVPMALGLLGVERYGAWMAIASSLAWVSVADLGIGNAFTNALASAIGRGDPAHGRVAMATAVWLLAGIGALLAGLGLVVGPAVNWAGFYRVRGPGAEEVGRALALGFVLACAGHPLAVLDRVWTVFGRGLVGGITEAAASLLSLAALALVTVAGGGLLLVVMATAGTSLAVRIAVGLWVFGVRFPELRPSWSAVDAGEARRLLGGGSSFFVAQVGALVLFSTDNIIVAKVLGPAQVTTYSVVWTLLSASVIAVQLAFPYLWASYAEAIARGDVAWVRATLRRSLIASTAAALVLAVPLALLGRVIVSFWTRGAVLPTQGLLWWMAAWNVLLAPATCVSCFLNANGKAGVQAWTSSLMIPLNVGLSVLFGRAWGTSGVIAATVITFATIGFVPALHVALRTARTLPHAGPPP